MITKNKIKHIKSLAQKKQRQKQGLFLAEGDKNVLEVLHSSLQVVELVATGSFLQKNKPLVLNAQKITEASSEELKKASLLKSPQNALAICAIPDTDASIDQLPAFSLYLDGIQDPGNLGTIIRTCDWFGADRLFCSPDTAAIYNPKVIQATMGSFCRIQTVYTPFEKLVPLAEASKVPLLGTFPEGENIYRSQLPARGLFIIGNEGRGIRPDVEKQIQSKISIPRFNTGGRPESLNAAVTAGIICSEFRRSSAGNGVTQNGSKG